MILLEITVGKQVRYFRAENELIAIRDARAEGLPDHLIRAGTLWTQPAHGSVASWMARADGRRLWEKLRGADLGN